MNKNIIKILRYILAIVLAIPLIALYLILALPLIAFHLMGLSGIVMVLSTPAFFWIDLIIEE